MSEIYGMRYKCLGIKPDNNLIPKIEMLSEVFKKIGWLEVNKLFSEEEIQMISDRLGIDMFSSFVWVSEGLEAKWGGDLNVTTINKSKNGNQASEQKAIKMGFIYGTDYEDLIPVEKQYRNCFEVIYEEFGEHILTDFDCSEFHGRVYDITDLNQKIITIVPK